jgi:hypothetical protein
LGHRVREFLFKGLMKDHRVAPTLSGDHRQAVRNLFLKTGPHLEKHHVLSSDLTAATDLLPHDLMGALVNGLVEACDLPVWANEILRLNTSE